MPEEDDKPTKSEGGGDAGWQFHNEEGAPNAPADQSEVSVEPVEWTASEFIAHNKGSSWYLLLGLGTIAVTVLTFIVTKDFLATGVVVVMCGIFGYFAARQPRELHYSLDDADLHIDEKLYPYSGFRSFAMVQEDGVESIWLMPLRRFMPQLTIYYAPSDGDKIVNTLAQFLPVENHQPDPIDRLIHRLRF